MKSHKTVIENKLDELTRLTEEIENFIEANSLPPKLSFTLNLVIEELITNTVSYGYKADDRREITILLELNKKEISVCITDDAMPFNPLAKEDPDINAKLENRPIGGLGIHLVKQMMDEVIYHRKNNQNVIILKKKID